MLDGIFLMVDHYLHALKDCIINFITKANVVTWLNNFSELLFGRQVKSLKEAADMHFLQFITSVTHSCPESVSQAHNSP